jgi:hypothetical protein
MITERIEKQKQGADILLANCQLYGIPAFCEFIKIERKGFSKTCGGI